MPRKEGKWSYITCTSLSCLRPSAINRWKCSCECLWLACPTHHKWPACIESINLTIQPHAHGSGGLVRTLSSSSLCSAEHIIPNKKARKRQQTAGAGRHLNDNIIHFSKPASTSSGGITAPSPLNAGKRAASSSFTPPDQLLSRGIFSKMPRLAAKFPHMAASSSPEHFSETPLRGLSRS
jgi:hypothetical protein